MDGQAEAGKAVQHPVQLFQPPVTLMLMALDADGADGNARLQQGFNQLRVSFAGVEIIDEQDGVRIAFPGGVKHLPDQAHPALFPADAGHGVVISVKLRHDHHFVDHIPHVDHAPVGADLPVNPVQLPAQNFRVIILEQPRRADGMPAQRMAFHLNLPLPQPSGRGHGFGEGGLSFHRLIAAPIERQGAVIEQGQPFLHSFPEKRLLLRVLRFHHRHGIKRAAAE